MSQSGVPLGFHTGHDGVVFPFDLFALIDWPILHCPLLPTGSVSTSLGCCWLAMYEWEMAIIMMTGDADDDDDDDDYEVNGDGPWRYCDGDGDIAAVVAAVDG